MTEMFSNALLSNEKFGVETPARLANCGKTETFFFVSVLWQEAGKLVSFFTSILFLMKKRTWTKTSNFVHKIWTLKFCQVAKVQKFRFLFLRSSRWLIWQRVSISHLVTIGTQLVFTFSTFSSCKKHQPLADKLSSPASVHSAAATQVCFIPRQNFCHSLFVQVFLKQCMNQRI